MRFELLVLAIGLSLLSAPHSGDAYSRGAPTHVCASMVPGHGQDIQTGAPPYALVVAPVDNGMAVSVVIKADTERSLAGFMLQSRHAVNRNQIIDGVFTEDKQSQIKNCNSNKANTLTHRSGSPKSRIDSVWTPPEAFTGDVVFRATLVKNKDTYWTEEDSEVVSFSNGKVAKNHKFMSNSNPIEEVENNDMSIENRIQENTQSVNTRRATSKSVLNYAICQQKFCLGLGAKADCIADKSCDLLLSGAYVNKTEGLTEFELNAIPQSGSHFSKYYSMGLSEDPNMGDDLVTSCYVTSDGKVKLGSSYNVGKDNILNDEHKDSLHLITANYQNGIVLCKWHSNRKRAVSNREWDLLTHKYYILLSMGALEDDAGKKQYHDMKIASGEPINLEEVGAAQVNDLSVLVRVHGAFMVAAWVGTVSVGIVFARYYKNTWVSTTLCGVKIWFAFHRALMVTSVLLIILAQICIFSYLNLEFRVSLHSMLGVGAVAIAFMNPIGALLRPHPDAPNRYIFNWAHWFLGNTGHILAIAAIFVATKLALADLPKPFLWTMISFVIFNVVIHLILQFHTFFMQNRSFNLVETHDIALHDMPRPSDDEPMGTDGPGSGFRRFIIGIYIVVISGFVIALVSLISLPKTTLDKMAIT